MGNCLGTEGDSKDKKKKGGGSASKGGAAGAKSKKIPMSHQYLASSLPKAKATYEQSRDPADYEVSGVHGPEGEATTGSAEGLQKVVANVGEAPCWVRLPGQVNDQRINIERCSGGSFLILDHCDSLQIDDCYNCVFFLGPTTGSVFIRNCKYCNFVVACGQMRTRDLKHCNLSLYCQSRPVLESSSNIGIGPFIHTGYFELRKHFAQAKLSTFNNRWSMIHDFTPGGKQNFHYLSVEETRALVPPLSRFGRTVGSHVTADEEEAYMEQPVVPLTHGCSSIPHDRKFLFFIFFRAGRIEDALSFTDGFAAAQESDAGKADGLLLLGTVEQQLTEESFATIEAPGDISPNERSNLFDPSGPTIAIGFAANVQEPAYWTQFQVGLASGGTMREEELIALMRSGPVARWKGLAEALFEQVPLQGMGFGVSH